MTANKQDIIYLNGDYLPRDQAKISVFDRGFLLGDAVYEVIPVYFGKAFRLAEHLKRLDDSLASIRIKNPLSNTAWTEIINRLIQQHDAEQQSIYLQVTRGISPVRDHVFPDDIEATVFVMSSPIATDYAKKFHAGIKAITLDDIRWKLCRIKATTLLANVLARQLAADQGALEAILIRDNLALEGAASNLFIVKDGVLITPPKGDELLPGITRDLILEIAAQHNIDTREQAIVLADLESADEVWLTSSVREIVPVIELNGNAVANGQPGPLFAKMNELYSQYKQQLKHD